MNNVQKLLSVLRGKGVELRVVGTSLRIHAPAGLLTSAEVEQIREYRDPIIEFLGRVPSRMSLLPIVIADRSQSLPLSFAQQRLWFIGQLEGADGAYHVPGAVRLRGILHRKALRAALDTIVERHEVLRTTFSQVDGNPVQVIAAIAGFALQEIDLSERAEQEREAEVERVSREEVRERFDLSQGPLIRGRLIRLSNDEHVLLVTMHHIVSDGWSVGILIREIAALYEAFSEGRTNPLVALPIQYADYAVWERDWLQGEALQEHVNYWKNQLAKAPILELPLDRSRPATRSYQGHHQTVFISAAVASALTELAHKTDTTLHMVLLAVYQVLLSRLSGQDDVVVASPIAGRSRRETEGLIGFFVNLLLLRIQVNGNLSFRELLARVREVALNAYAHQGLPFDKLMAELQGERLGSATALARVAFTMQNATQARIEVPGLKLNRLAQAGITAKNDLLLTIQEGTEGLYANFEYATELFDATTIEIVGRRFVRLVNQVVARPDMKLDEIDLSLPERTDDTTTKHRLSSNQQVMWVDLQIHPEKASYYNIVDYVEIAGEIDPDIFERAIQHVVNCTGALRVQFTLTSNITLEQEILPSRLITVPLLDFSREPDPSVAAQAWVEQNRKRRIDPVNEVPFSFALLKLSVERFYWYSHYHHLIMDGVGLLLVKNRVAKAYSALIRDCAPGLLNDQSNYAEYLHWDSEYRYSAIHAHDKAYWLANCTKSDSVSLSVRTTSAPPGEPLRIRGSLKAGVGGALKSYAKLSGLSFSRFMIAAFALYMNRLMDREQLSIGLPTHGRFDKSSQELVAACTNISPVKCAIGSGSTIKQAVLDIAQRLKESLDHGRYGYEEIRRLLGLRPQDSPLFNVTVNALANLDAMDFAGLRGETRSFARYENDLIVWILFARDHDGLEIAFYGNPHLYERWELEGHLQRFGWFLEELAGLDADRLIGELPILSAAERLRVLVEFNATDVAYSEEKLIQELFEEQVEKTPNAIAVVYEGQQLTYGELNRRANQVAHCLREQGVGPNQLVAICVNRSFEMVVSLLGVLKAGGAYVPLDPSYPSERLAYMVEESAPRVILTQSMHIAILPVTAAQIIALDGQWNAIAQYPENNLGTGALGLKPEDLAYVIYTSGSTGRPKGASVKHRGLRNLLEWYTSEFEFSNSDHTLIVSSFSFDLTQKNFFAGLLTGGQVHLAVEPFDGHRIAQQISSAKITALNLTPAAFYSIVDADTALPALLSSLRCVFLGGEPINLVRISRLGSVCPQLNVINSYGPTECTDVVAFYRLKAGWATDTQAFVPIGRPISNTQIYILDVHGEPVPIGVSGELYIGGVGVARGYLNRPELTAERFIADPFSQDANARLYKTGDVGRWRADGNIEYLGRNDHQVKIRGYRIELGEIESQLARHEHVKEAVVIAREDVAGDKRLVGYITVTGEAPNMEAIREQLKGALPEYMVPSAIMVLERFPLTPNGKLDRKALPAPDMSALSSKRYEAPQGEIEEALAKIWQELLHVERVGRHDNFFELGGHSLLAVQLMTRIRQVLCRELALHELFKWPTVQALTKQLGASQLVTLTPILRVDRSQRLPLSYAQQRLWFIDQLEGVGSAYHITGAVRLHGALDRVALQATLDSLIERHEILRTVFSSVDGQSVQIVTAEASFALQQVDLGALTSEDREAEVRREAAEEAQARFDLSKGPLIRGRLIRLSDAEHVLLVTMHHIVSDGWSIGILIREIGVLYAAYREGRKNPLPPLAIQYADYAVWQQAWLQGEALQNQFNYWKQQLSGAPALLELPTDRPRPLAQSYRGGSVGFGLSARLSKQLNDFSRQHDATLFMTLYTGFAILLSRLSGQEDIVIGAPMANRHRAEVEGLIGFFVNTLALRVQLGGDPSVSLLLKQVKEMTLAAYSHQELPFEQVVEAVQPPRSLSHSPVFQVMLTLQNTPRDEVTLPGLTLAPQAMSNSAAQFDLTLSLQETGERIVGNISYASDLFDRVTIERWVEHFKLLLAGMVQDVEQRVGSIGLLSEREREQVLREFNATEVGYSQEKLIQELFEEQVEKSPDAIAVVYEAHQLTYRELNTRANQLAHYLRGQGVRPDQLVAICVERSVEMVIGIVGILKAGGAYVPLDPSYPRERLEYMLKDAAPRVLLTQETLRAALPVTTAEIVTLDSQWSEIATHASDNIDPLTLGLTSTHLAYVIYTSGSTGQPKGVMNQHQGIVNRLGWMQDKYELNQADRVLQKTPFSFDVSVWEFFWPLLNGARLIMARPRGHQDPAYLSQLIQDEGITTLHFVPSMLQHFLDLHMVQQWSSLRRIVCSGEELAPLLQAKCLEYVPHAQLHNLYGPTEAAIDVTYWDCRVDSGISRVPIGRPISNTQIYILDVHGEPVPIGVSGELYIGGVGVARGYLNRPELTAERFIADPFSQDANARMYKTGDVGRWRADGNIEYLGRNDHQVKIRGYRIELGEIESQLARHEHVKEAVVIAREDVAGDKRLVGYITVTGEAPNMEAIREQLKGALPEYMVPSAIMVLERFPLTPNGKLDRKALPAPDMSALSSKRYEAPQGEIEEALAKIWQELLHVERVGRHDNFFELGGHSLLAVQVIVRLREVLSLDLSLRIIFQHPSIVKLGASIYEARNDLQGRVIPKLQLQPRPKTIPLSCAQERLWLLDQLGMMGAAHNIPGALRLDGMLNIAALRRSFTELVARHENLRTRFVVVDDVPQQIIDPATDFSLTVTDLSQLNEGERNRTAKRLIRESTEYRFDLSRGPLCRASVLRLGDREYLLLFVMNHIISDGWSLGVMTRELSALYGADPDTQMPSLAPLTVQYADYSIWQRQWLQGEECELQLQYWKTQLLGMPQVLELPLDRPRPAVMSQKGAVVRFTLLPELHKQLMVLTEREGATIFMALLAVFQGLLSRYTGQEDVVVGSPMAGRTHQETESLIGVFLNIVVLRTNTSGDPSFRTLLKRVKEVAVGAYTNQDIPFERLWMTGRIEAKWLVRTPAMGIDLFCHE